jgi:serine/threonine-protein kinase
LHPTSEKDQAADEDLQGVPDLSFAADLGYTWVVVALAENMIVAERFRLNRMIGRGGMGSVWHATHLGLDTACAIKFIEGDFASLPEAHARFEREAKAAAQLRSPHVVQIMDNGVWEGRPYIAMELLDGEDLKKRLASGKMLPNEIASILTQVCRALSKAHALGIVHRDLKPDNIFLVRDDDREIAKVLDFGIAKRQDTVDGSNTRTGAMLGTPYYMSPEQAQGTKSVDHRSDLWSLAVIAYQAITGKLPFQSEALGDLLVKIIVHPIPTPSHVAQVPPGFDAWFARATQRDPAQRFQSAKDFADSLTLAIGASQITDMMDGRMLRAQIAAGHTAAMGSGPHLPFGQTPQPNMPFGQTPQPGNMPFGQTPQPNHMAGMPPPSQQSSPSFHQSSGGFPGHGNTGAPFTTTASGSTQMPAKSMSGIIVGGLVGLVAMVAVGFGAFRHFSAHDTPAPPATSAATAAPIIVATTTATPTGLATSTTTPAASASAASTPAVTTTPAVTPAVTTVASNPTATTASASNDHPSTNSGSSSSGSSSSSSNTSGSSSAGSTSAKAQHGSHTANTPKSSKAEDGVEKMGF